MTEYIFSNTFEVQYDEKDESLLIWHPKVKADGLAPTRIAKTELAKMSFDDAAKFIGEKFLLCIPSLRQEFQDYLWTDDGYTPPKKS
jgi:hypothetical protein